MNSRLRLLAVVVLLTATALMLMHWYQDVDGQRCEMCRVQQLPSVHTPVQDPIPVPAVREWAQLIVDTAFDPGVFVMTSRGRAPPAFLFV